MDTTKKTILLGGANSDKTRIPHHIIQEFLENLQTKIQDYREREGYTKPVHDYSNTIQHIEGRKYDKINMGDCGKWMLEASTGKLFFTKGYGRVDNKKFFGYIMDLNKVLDKWWYDGYSIAPIGESSQYGFVRTITKEG